MQDRKFATALLCVFFLSGLAWSSEALALQPSELSEEREPSVSKNCSAHYKTLTPAELKKLEQIKRKKSFLESLREGLSRFLSDLACGGRKVLSSDEARTDTLEVLNDGE